MEKSFVKVRVIHGDIREVTADVLVNPINTNLLFPDKSGVLGAIMDAAGDEVKERLNKIRLEKGGLEHAEPIATPAGNLQARFLFHVAGPVNEQDSKEEKRLLLDSYINCLKLAEQLKVQSVAFPNIGTGNNLFPKARAARIIYDGLQGYLSTLTTVKELIFVCRNVENAKIYNQLWGEVM